MCDHGDTVLMRVTMPALVSHTGSERQAIVRIDRCLGALVSELNRAGHRTANSCCGHGRGPGSIVFADGVERTIEASKRLVDQEAGNG